MMNSDCEQMIIEEARIFAQNEIRPLATKFDETGEISPEIIKQLAAKKFLTASFPEKYGGLGLDPVSYGLFIEEIGKVCCSTRTLMTVHASLVGESLLRWGTQEQKDTWLPLMSGGDKIGAFALTEPEVGSDAKGIKTAYEKRGNTFIINGRKKWISFGGLADFFVVIASRNQQVTAFIVERNFEGVCTRRIQGMLAGRATYTAEIEFHNVVVPEKNVLGKMGIGFPFIVGTALDHGRYSIAWAGVAVAQASLEAMVSYARKRSQFGKKIHEFQLVKGLIADAVTKVHAARSLCLQAGGLRKKEALQGLTETTIAKYFASKVAFEVATDAVQIHGGNGCSNKYPVERLFREAKILEIIEGTSQIQQELISHYGLKKYFQKEYPLDF